MSTDPSVNAAEDVARLALGLPRPLQGLKPGTVLGPYRLVRELGRGGMGLVVEAEHTIVRRRVALKVLAADRASPKARQRFLNEARAAAGLRHPHVIAVHDAGQAGDLHYMAMDLVQGESLSQRLERDGPLPIDEAIDLTIAMADALRTAHDQGILHRDIKPGNIMLDTSGRPFLADFGLAKLTDTSQTGLTKTNEIVGTPAYMSPEQATGKAKHADGRVDLYSLGATLYEALTGAPPFEGVSMIALIAQITSVQPKPPSSLRAAVSSELEAVILRCLAKDPQDRYPTAAALLADLEACRKGASATASKARGPACAFVALLLSASVVAGALIWLLSTAPSPTEPEPEQSVSANEAPPTTAESVTPTNVTSGPHWVHLTPAKAPSPRFDAAMIWHPGLREVVLHGGRQHDNDLQSDLWSWDGRDWTPRDVSGPALAVHGLVYDDRRECLVAFGGLSRLEPKAKPRASSAVWLWDGRWRGQSKLGRQRPNPRFGFGMAYDAERSRTVVSGGYGSKSSFGDTWALTPDGWEFLAQGSQRFYFRAAYDPRRKRIVRFGGWRPGKVDLRDYSSLGSVEWESHRVPLPASHNSPLVSTKHGMVLLGGVRGRTPLREAWLETEDGWQPLPPAPRNLISSSAAYDPVRDAIVVFGRRQDGLSRQLMLELRFRGSTTPTPSIVPATSGVRWKERKVATAPSPRYATAMAYDPALRKTLLFGGKDAKAPATLLGDTWTWDGTQWVREQGEGPGNRVHHAMAYDPSRRAVVLCGGAARTADRQVVMHSDTWRWSRSGWELLHERDPVAKGRREHELAYDGGSAALVMIGGVARNNQTGWYRGTLSLGSTGWTPHAVGADPSPRLGHGLTASPDGRGLLLFGGLTPDQEDQGDLWELRQAAWRPLSPPGPAPGPRRKHGIVTTPRGVLVLGGLRDRRTFLQDAWLYDGSGWHRLPDLPAPLEEMGVSYDSARDVVVIFGGAEGYERITDRTFELVWDRTD